MDDAQILNTFYSYVGHFSFTSDSRILVDFDSRDIRRFQVLSQTNVLSSPQLLRCLAATLLSIKIFSHLFLEILLIKHAKDIFFHGSVALRQRKVPLVETRDVLFLISCLVGMTHLGLTTFEAKIGLENEPSIGMFKKIHFKEVWHQIVFMWHSHLCLDILYIYFRA